MRLNALQGHSVILHHFNVTLVLLIVIHALLVQLTVLHALLPMLIIISNVSLLALTEPIKIVPYAPHVPCLVISVQVMYYASAVYLIIIYTIRHA